MRLALFAVLATLGLALSGPGGSTTSAGAAPEAGPFAYSIELNATIDPATERWIHKALGEAKDKHATVAIIRIDTPGGLDSSMRSIIKDILAAPMPVIAYVYPNGSRAASAGMYITEAADVAAMAPQTNIGSATPIDSSGGDIKGSARPQGAQRRGGLCARARQLARPQRGRGRADGHQGHQPPAAQALKVRTSST